MLRKCKAEDEQVKEESGGQELAGELCLQHEEHYLWCVTKKSIYNPSLVVLVPHTHTHIYTLLASEQSTISAMERGSIALFIILLFVLCFPISSDSQKLSPSISLHDQEQAHEVTIEDIKREEDKSIDIFRVGVGSHGVTGGKGGGRKASPKRSAAMELRPKLFFSTTSLLFTSFIMLSLTSVNMSI
ncbi:hypothetical protein Bca4012_096608 [Brassica carinata]